MKNLYRALLAASVAVVASATLISGLAGTASAAGNPPWEPDASSVGGLLFFNSAGQQITGGTITSAPLAAYVEGTTVIRSGDTKATLYGYTPVLGQSPGAWSGEAISASDTYPNSGAPGSLSTSALPLVTGGSGDESIQTYTGDYPNNDTSTTDGYAGLYVLRLKTAASGKAQTATYDSADISVTGNTWSVVYPAISPIATTTALTTSSAPYYTGASVTLTATVTPGVAGTVQFLDGTTDLGSPVTVSGGTASTTASFSTVATHNLSAVFTPTAPAQFLVGYASSTGTDSINVQQAPAAATTTSLQATPSTAAANAPVTLTATVSSGGNPLASGTGTVTFYDVGSSTGTPGGAGSTLLGTQPVGASGTASVSTSFTTAQEDTEYLAAQFTPANPATYVASASSNVPFVVTAPAFPTGNVDVSISNGGVTLSTIYTNQNPFSLGSAQLNAGATEYTATGAFGSSTAHAITITSTKAGDASWTATASATDFSNGAGGGISAENLALTGLTPTYLGGNAYQAGSVTLTQLGSSAVTGSVSPYAFPSTGNDGLFGAAKTFATASGPGTVYIDGTLSLVAPTSTLGGNYATEVTLTAS